MKGERKQVTGRWIRLAWYSTVCAILTLAQAETRAEDHFWSSLGGGSFNYWLNWVPNYVPGEDDNAIFDLDMDPAYEVTFYESVTNDQCIFRTDKVIMDLGGSTYTLDHPDFGLIVGYDYGQVAELLLYNGTLAATAAHIGLWEGSDGALNLESGTNLDVTNFILVGNDGNGLMNINPGASVTAGHLTVAGHDLGNTGLLNIDGSSAELTVDGILRVGEGGTGYFNLMNGATVYTQVGYVGDSSTSYGEININGESEFEVGEWLVIGSCGTGLLSITEASQFGIADLYVSNTADAYGQVDLWGNDSSIDADRYIIVGNWGTGTMNASQDADVTAESILVGVNESAQGELNISGSGTTVTVQNNLTSGLYGVGTINITGGADVRTTEPGGWIYVGQIAGSDGYLLVDGGSTLIAEQAPLVVGEEGSAGMDILGGSEVTSAGELFMGWVEGSVGQLTISGTGSKYISESGYPAQVGDGGEGTLIIEDGGVFEKLGGFHLGMQSTGVGTVTLNGDDSTFKVGEHLNVGEYGSGTFNVNDGHVAVGELDVADVPSGELHVAGWAWLTGTGTLNGDVIAFNGSNVMPGGEPGGTQTGVLTISGNYTQQDATLAIRVKGTTAGDEYSALHVTGTATIANTLEIRLVETYFPQGGEQYVVLNADSLDGTFPAVIGPGLYDVTYDEHNVTVTVLNAPGDLDGDNDVDLSDLAQLLGFYGDTGVTYEQGDIDHDGDVDLADLATLLGYYGR